MAVVASMLQSEARWASQSFSSTVTHVDAI
jgi:hypothetical protein